MFSCLNKIYVSMSNYQFSEEFNFVVFKTEKTALINLHEEEIGESENEECEAIGRVTLPLL